MPVSETGHNRSEEMIWGINPVLEALEQTPGLVSEVLILRGKTGPRLQQVIDSARGQGVRLRFVDPGRLGVGRQSKHQGVTARLQAAPCLTLQDLAEELAGHPDLPPILVLDQIQDPRNLGSILRTSLAAGFCHIILPRERSAPLTGTVARTSAGAIAHLKICQVGNVSDALAQLKALGYWTYGAVVEPGADAVYEVEFSSGICLVLGSEGKGIRPLVRRQCDHLVTIPMHRDFDSLNVAVAAGVLLFEIQRQRRGR